MRIWREMAGYPDLAERHKKRKEHIRQRLGEFRKRFGAYDRVIFEELCFCLFTPQAKAVVCDRAVKKIRKAGLLFKGTKKDIRPHLKGVRFPNNKAGYLLCARKLFSNCNGLKIKDKLDRRDTFKTRDWLARNVKGLGYKEASHFLRNIGLGKDMAILDVHILRNLKRYGVIKRIPGSLSKKTYLDTEHRMRRFSQKVGIPIEELDLLFWSDQTGFIFK